MRTLRKSLLWALIGVVFVGCSDDDSNPIPMVNVAGKHSVEVGKSIALTASTANGKDRGYSFASGDTTIATVDEQGVVTGIAQGETTITVNGIDTGIGAVHPIVVVGEPGGTSVIQISGNLVVQLGKTTTLTATTINGTDSSYTWSSDDEAIATIGEDGVVMGVGAGSTTIKVIGADTQKEATASIIVSVEAPASAEWRTSGHAKGSSEAFRHWDEDDPPTVPTSCAKCHASAGFADFVGADGSEAGKVDQAATPSYGITCEACHSPEATALSSVTFPSGVVVNNLGPEARCMTCHQGRESTDSVNTTITDAALADDDTVSDKLGFKNIHYFAAGATLMGGITRGGYQYTDHVYDTKFRHADGIDSCVGCHNPHSLEIKIDLCKKCHESVSTVADLKKIRMIDSMNDYDGDGKTDGGLDDEIVGLRNKLMQALQAYAKAKSTAICYSSSAYPYFFVDTNSDDSCDSTEAVYANAYKAFTARSLRAAYNYQVSIKDPGAYAHNAKYIIQLLFDSISDLNTQLGASSIDMTNAVRNDVGHFNGAGEAARHWDSDEEVSASCAKCHAGSKGLRFFVENGVNIGGVEPDNGLECATCHDKLGGNWDLMEVKSAPFPSGLSVTFVAEGDISNTCAHCHSGRESKKTVDERIATGKYAFRNVHYKPAAATIAGTEAQVGYEYDNKTYAGMSTHNVTSCVKCHNPVTSNHSFMIKDAYAKGCGSTCHTGVSDFYELKNSARAGVDYDGSGTVETLKAEHAGMATVLFAQIQNAAGANPICYDAHSYPYWFKDTDNSGQCDGAEVDRANGYGSWTPALMKAAFNYQYYVKEVGAWAHNFDYMAQLLFDSIEDLGGTAATAGMTRP